MGKPSSCFTSVLFKHRENIVRKLAFRRLDAIFTNYAGPAWILAQSFSQRWGLSPNSWNNNRHMMINEKIIDIQALNQNIISQHKKYMRLFRFVCIVNNSWKKYQRKMYSYESSSCYLNHLLYNVCIHKYPIFALIWLHCHSYVLWQKI